VKGLRVGEKPDGQEYVHAGRDGLYFRENLGQKPSDTPQEKPKGTYQDDPSVPLPRGVAPADAELLDMTQKMTLRSARMEWQLKKDNGKVYTADSAETVKKWYREGRVRPDTSVYHPILKRWMHVRDISALRVPQQMDPNFSVEDRYRASLDDLQQEEKEYQELVNAGPSEELTSYDEMENELGGSSRSERLRQIQSFEEFLSRPHTDAELRSIERSLNRRA
jgi:hypothetical protein